MASLWQQGRRRLPTLLPPAPAPAPALQETGSCHSSCCFAHGIGALRPEGPGHLAHIEGECQRLLAGPSVRSRAGAAGEGPSPRAGPGPAGAGRGSSVAEGGQGGVGARGPPSSAAGLSAAALTAKAGAVRARGASLGACGWLGTMPRCMSLHESLTEYVAPLEPHR